MPTMKKPRVIDPRVRQLKAQSIARAITAVNEAAANGQLQVVRPADGQGRSRSTRVRVVGAPRNRVEGIH